MISPQDALAQKCLSSILEDGPRRHSLIPLKMTLLQANLGGLQEKSPRIDCRTGNFPLDFVFGKAAVHKGQARFPGQNGRTLVAPLPITCLLSIAPVHHHPLPRDVSLETAIPEGKGSTLQMNGNSPIVPIPVAQSHSLERAKRGFSMGERKHGPRPLQVYDGSFPSPLAKNANRHALEVYAAVGRSSIDPGSKENHAFSHGLPGERHAPGDSLHGIVLSRTILCVIPQTPVHVNASRVPQRRVSRLHLLAVRKAIPVCVCPPKIRPQQKFLEIRESIPVFILARKHPLLPFQEIRNAILVVIQELMASHVRGAPCRAEDSQQIPGTAGRVRASGIPGGRKGSQKAGGGEKRILLKVASPIVRQGLRAAAEICLKEAGIAQGKRAIQNTIPPFSLPFQPEKAPSPCHARQEGAMNRLERTSRGNQAFRRKGLQRSTS